MKDTKRVLIAIFAILTLISLLPIAVLATTANAKSGTDAMPAIEAAFANEKRGETTRVSNDGYIGIPVEISVYHAGGEIQNGKTVGATPIAIYVVNTQVERIGTDSDVNIISSMLERGYVVVIFDYLNSTKATSPDLDWSVQGLRTKVTDGTYMKNRGLPSGSYNNNMVVPAGYNADFGLVYWEIDKHAADGTLERIVEVWNNDFRAKKGTKLVKWVDESGNRKATQNGLDGSAPVWLDANGNESANGEYILVKHTKAEKIQDCVREDGIRVELDLTMHVIYPTNPGYNVPVMVLSNSSGYLASGSQTEDRPQLNGFLFNGYVGVTFDHGWVPMARDDHYGYFDGDDADSVTGDNATYSIHNLNNGRIDTAAMRYVRYLSLSDHEKYSFDSTAIGVYGNSKGGWATILGEENPDIYYARRIYDGFNGKSRYENGKTEDIVFGSYVIDGGEEQPWLTYNGTAIDGGADLTYMSCGSGSTCITSSHSPTFLSCNLGDGSYAGVSNQSVNACRTADVVTLWFEVDQGHTFASANDMRYGVNTYQAFFDFAAYHLKGEAVQVVYASREADKFSGMPTNAPIVVKFTGSVTADEVAKITLVNSKGEVVSGRWTAEFGNTEWTLNTPTLGYDEQYVLTVPAGIVGDNGKAMTEAYTYEFRTGRELASDMSAVTTSRGTYFYFTKPDTSLIEEFNVELYTLRLSVSNDATNKLLVYPVTGFDPASPDSAKRGSLLCSVPVTGIGQYDVDVTDYTKTLDTGSTVAFLVKQENAAGEELVHASPLTNSLGSCTKGNKVSTVITTAPDGTTALKIHKFSSSTSFVNDKFYQNFATLFTNASVIKSGELTEDDIGRTFRISFKIYDTTSRIVSVQMSSLSNYSKLFADYNVSFYNIQTKANEWVEVSFEHTVYEPLYADIVGNKWQKLTVSAPLEGCDINEIYISNVKSYEIFTDVDFEKAEMLLGTTEQRTNPLITEYGTIPDVYESADDYPFVLFDNNGNFIGAHTSFLDTASAFNNDGALHLAKAYMSKANYWNGENYGDSPVSVYILLRKDYTMTADERYDNLAQVQGLVTVDLGGHTMSAAKDRTLFPATIKQWSGSGDADYYHDTEFKFINGTMVTYDKSLVTYACSAVKYKKFDIHFEDVTIKALGSAKNFLVDYSTTSSTTAGKPNVTFKNCKIDVSQATADSINVFTVGTDKIQTTYTVTGCTLIADSTPFNLIRSVGASTDATFAKDANGKYLTVIADSSLIPIETYNGDKLVFAETDKANTYTLMSRVLTELEFEPMASITLESDFIFNVYIPVRDAIAALNFAGTGVTVSKLERAQINGADYYVIRTPMAASEAASALPMVVTLTADGESLTKSYEFSVIKYAELVLAEGNDTEKQLVRDTLSYIRAAYAYFGTTDAEAMAKITAILGDGYDENNAHTSEGATDAEASGIMGATFVLDETPAIRFYLEDGPDTASYAFFIDGESVSVRTGEDVNGAYVEIDAPAYALCGTVTYTVGGEAGGSYHIASYFKYATEDGDAALISLVDRMWKYFQSAREYESRVIGE